MKVKHAKDAQPRRMSYGMTIFIIGISGGIFWSLIGYLAFYLNFINFGPALILKPWALGEWKNSHYGQLVGVLTIGILSIGLAFVYKLLFQKIRSFWAGVVFGLILWVIVFHFVNPFMPSLQPVAKLDQNTVVTSICLYVAYGLFIGYSISYAYIEQNQKRTTASNEKQLHSH